VVLVALVLMKNVYYYLGISNLFINKMAAIGMAFFILSHFYDMSMRFLDALALSRKTSKELEEQVAFRTKELYIANRRLERMATHDELTNLYNRNELHRQIEDISDQRKLQSAKSNQAFTVVYFDSPTKRVEWKHLDGSTPERVPGKQGEIPRTLVRKRRRSLRFSGLALGH
jgi:predicted nucleic acid-binding protein